MDQEEIFEKKRRIRRGEIRGFQHAGSSAPVPESRQMIFFQQKKICRLLSREIVILYISIRIDTLALTGRENESGETAI